MYTSNIIVEQENTNGSSNLSVMFALCRSLEILLTYKDITFMMLTFRAVWSLGLPLWIHIQFRDKKCLWSFNLAYRASARRGYL